jgi:hypothetical protein
MCVRAPLPLTTRKWRVTSPTGEAVLIHVLGHLHSAQGLDPGTLSPDDKGGSGSLAGRTTPTPNWMDMHY